jgi:hypothetical protein
MDFLPQYQGEEALMASGTSPVTGLPVSRATPGAYNMPKLIPQAGAVPVAGSGAAQIGAVRAESPFQADAMQLQASGEMDAATFQASSKPIDQWATGEVVTFQTPEGNMSANQYNTRLAELKGTRLQPISPRGIEDVARTARAEALRTQQAIEAARNRPLSEIRGQAAAAKQAGLHTQQAIEEAARQESALSAARAAEQISGIPDLGETGVPELSLGEQVVQDLSDLVPSFGTDTPEAGIEIIDGKKYTRGWTVVDGEREWRLKEVKPPWYTSKEVLGPAASAAIPAVATAILADDPEDDPEEEVKKLGSTDPRRIAYNKWVLIEDKNSPEALALRDTWYGKPRYSMADLQSKWGATQLGAPRGIAQGARGGEVVGRGTGSSDSIPARLSDGEFVMTADAVRNAGNGDRNLGAARMYDMMSRFERMG